LNSTIRLQSLSTASPVCACRKSCRNIPLAIPVVIAIVIAIIIAIIIAMIGPLEADL